MSRNFPAERGNLQVSAFDKRCLSNKCIPGKFSEIYTIGYNEKNKISTDCLLKEDFTKYAMKKPHNEKNFIKYIAGLKKWEQCFDKAAIKTKYNKYYLDMLACGKKHNCYSKSYKKRNNKTKKTNKK